MANQEHYKPFFFFKEAPLGVHFMEGCSFDIFYIENPFAVKI